MQWITKLVVLVASLVCLPSHAHARGLRQPQAPEKEHDGREHRSLQTTPDEGVEVETPRNDTEMMLDVIIKFKRDMNASTLSNGLSEEVTIESSVSRLSLSATTVPASMVESIRNDPAVDYVVPNGRVVKYAETIPFGIPLALGENPSLIPSAPASTTDECAIKIGVVDDGLDVGHYDFNFCGVNELTGETLPNRIRKCFGRAFVESGDANNGVDWFNANVNRNSFHGTHVSGIIAASSTNGLGITGMVGDGQVCLYMSNVFGTQNQASDMRLIQGIEWLVNQGVDIINLSLGGTARESAVEDAILDANEAGILVVAASGNSGSDEFNYPASYSDVISVAAIDRDSVVAGFSTFNAEVDLAAPGEQILSAFPRTELVADADLTTADGTTFFGFAMSYTSYLGTAGITGTLVDCGIGTSNCPTSGSTVCLIERGGGTFFEKITSCVNGGGIAAIVYDSNDDAEPFGGTMGATNNVPNSVPISAVSVTRSDGLELLALAGQEINISMPLGPVGYATVDGTSFACPHVVGAAALIMRACPSCGKEDVTSCLLSTALDLGASGRDDFYGEGLVQADLAFICLESRACCDGIDGLIPVPVPATSRPTPISPAPTPASLTPSPTGTTPEPTSSSTSEPSLPTFQPGNNVDFGNTFESCPVVGLLLELVLLLTGDN